MQGNYKAAHDLLLDNIKQLRASRNKISADLVKALMLLHSYLLARVLELSNS